MDDAVEPDEAMPTQPAAALAVKSTVVDPNRRPDLNSLTSIVLRQGPQHRVQARLTVVRDRNTSQTHHDALTIETIRTRGGKEVLDEKHSLTLSSDDDADEIGKLIDFVALARGGEVTQQSGHYVAVHAPSDGEQEAALQEILGRLQATGDYKAFAQVLEGVGKDPEFLKALMDRAAQHPRLFAEAAAAINLATYTSALEQLKKYVRENETHESAFQSLLADNPWMFGSEYSKNREHKATYAR